MHVNVDGSITNSEFDCIRSQCCRPVFWIHSTLTCEHCVLCDREISISCIYFTQTQQHKPRRNNAHNGELFRFFLSSSLFCLFTQFSWFRAQRLHGAECKVKFYFHSTWVDLVFTVTFSIVFCFDCFFLPIPPGEMQFMHLQTENSDCSVFFFLSIRMFLFLRLGWIQWTLASTTLQLRVNLIL